MAAHQIGERGIARNIEHRAASTMGSVGCGTAASLRPAGHGQVVRTAGEHQDGRAAGKFVFELFGDSHASDGVASPIGEWPKSMPPIYILAYHHRTGSHFDA